MSCRAQPQPFRVTMMLGTLALLTLSLLHGARASCTARNDCARCTRQTDGGTPCSFCSSAGSCSASSFVGCSGHWLGSGYGLCPPPPPPKPPPPPPRPRDPRGDEGSVMDATANANAGLSAHIAGERSSEISPTQKKVLFIALWCAGWCVCWILRCVFCPPKKW